MNLNVYSSIYQNVYSSIYQNVHSYAKVAYNANEMVKLADL